MSGLKNSFGCLPRRALKDPRPLPVPERPCTCPAPEDLPTGYTAAISPCCPRHWSTGDREGASPLGDVFPLAVGRGL